MIPPHNTEIEEAVLGALLIEKNALLTVIDTLTLDCFYSDKHAEIYRAIRDLHYKGEPVDMRTVKAELREKKQLDFVGGAYRIAELGTKISSAGNIEAYATILVEHAKRRALIGIGRAITNNAFDEGEDVLELIDKSLTHIYTLAQPTANTEKTSTDLMAELVGDLDGKPVRGVPTGLKGIDEATKGMHKGDLIIIAARPGMGKSALSTTIALNSNTPTVVFSLEMSKRQVMARLVSAKMDINIGRILHRTLGMNEKERIKGCKIDHVLIDDSPALTVHQLRTRATRYKKLYGIELIVVDYLQLMRGGANYKGNRDQEMGEISRGLKQLAKELEVPVIALAQLSRAVEMTQDKKPKLSHLRESGNLEQDADIVAFLWRPEYYNILSDEFNEPYDKGYTEFSIQKHRNGGLENIPIKFIGESTKFVSLEKKNDWL